MDPVSSNHPSIAFVLKKIKYGPCNDATDVARTIIDLPGSRGEALRRPVV